MTRPATLSPQAQRELLALCVPDPATGHPHPVEVRTLSHELQEHALSFLDRKTRHRPPPQPVCTTLFCGHPYSAVSSVQEPGHDEPTRVCAVCGGGNPHEGG